MSGPFSYLMLAFDAQVKTSEKEPLTSYFRCWPQAIVLHIITHLGHGFGDILAAFGRQFIPIADSLGHLVLSLWRVAAENGLAHRARRLDGTRGVNGRRGCLCRLRSLHESRLVCRWSLRDGSGIHVVVEDRRRCAVQVRIVCDRDFGNSIWCQELETWKLVQDGIEDLRWED